VLASVAHPAAWRWMDEYRQIYISPFMYDHYHHYKSNKKIIEGGSRLVVSWNQQKAFYHYEL